jgi:hypothetical protein
MKIKLTRPQESALVAALLYGVPPVVFNATAYSLKKMGLFGFDDLGNFILTYKGRLKAKQALNRLSKLKRVKAA